MRRIQLLLGLLLALCLSAGSALTPGVVWPYPPAGIAASDYVATCVGGLLAQIEADELPACDPDNLGSYYYLPAPDGNRAYWVRLNLIVSEWSALPDTSRAKVRFRIY